MSATISKLLGRMGLLMFSRSPTSNSSEEYSAEGYLNTSQPIIPDDDRLVTIDEVQKSLNRSRASVYRYTNTDPRNINPSFNPRKLNPEFRTDQKDPLLFHPNEVGRFAKDVLRIKEVTVEVLNSPSSATQQVLESILDEIRAIRVYMEASNTSTADFTSRRDRQDRPAA